jgi:hypothetical protein
MPLNIAPASKLTKLTAMEAARCTTPLIMMVKHANHQLGHQIANLVLQSGLLMTQLKDATGHAQLFQ